MHSVQCTVYYVQSISYSLTLQSLKIKSGYQFETGCQKPSFIIGIRNFSFCNKKLLKCCVPKTNLGFFHESTFTDNFVDFCVFFMYCTVHCAVFSTKSTIWHELFNCKHCTNYIIYSTLNRGQCIVQSTVHCTFLQCQE